MWCCSKCGAVYHKDFPRCPNDGAEVVLSLRDPLLDQHIGHYAIDRLIGEGGMGRVYAAHHTSLPAMRYAIKVLLGDVAATSSMRRRFAMEAESASRLDQTLRRPAPQGQRARGQHADVVVAAPRYTGALAFRLKSGIRLKTSVEYYQFSDFSNDVAIHLGVATPF